MKLSDQKTHTRDGKPLYKSAVTKPRLKQPAPVVAKGETWWAPFADPSIPREAFAEAAKQNDEAKRGDPKWQRPVKLQQIGQL